MAKRRKKGFVSEQQRKKVMAELKSGRTRPVRREYRRDHSDYVPLIITYPKDHTIKMPTSSPTFSISKLDEALDDIFKKKKR